MSSQRGSLGEATKLLSQDDSDYFIGHYNLRRRVMAVCIAVGLGTPMICYIIALSGAVLNSEGHLDKIAVFGVLLAVYCPFIAFIDNPGERGRTLKHKLLDCGYYWWFANAGFQLFWELGWFINKRTLMSGTVTEHDTFYWPWYAYGMADTRYLSHNDLVLAISSIDASIAIPECVGMYLAFQNYGVLTSWIGLILTACETWGQYYFYIDEVYKNFDDMEDGALGGWLKLGFLNFPWLIFCWLGGAGFMWNLADIYKRRGVEEYLAQQAQHVHATGRQAAAIRTQPTEYQAQPASINTQTQEDDVNANALTKFVRGVDLYLLTDEITARSLGDGTTPRARVLVYFILVFPWVFLTVDWFIYAKQEGWI